MKLVECKEAWGDIFNIGGKEEITIGSLAQLIKETLDSFSDIMNVPCEQAYEEGFEDMKRRKPGISKIQKLIDFNSQFTLQDIIVDVAEYQEQEN